MMLASTIGRQSMIRSLLLLFVAGAILGVTTQGSSAQTTLPFSGTVSSTCVLTVGTPGVIFPNAAYDQLSSQNAGGTSGVVTALATDSSYEISADAPVSFTAAPAGGDSGVTFEVTYQGTGATNIGATVGNTPTQLNAGTTTLEVDLSASKSSGTFPAGNYATEVTVRCE
jgi:hypothetical protein